MLTRKKIRLLLVIGRDSFLALNVAKASDTRSDRVTRTGATGRSNDGGDSNNYDETDNDIDFLLTILMTVIVL